MIFPSWIVFITATQCSAVAAAANGARRVAALIHTPRQIAAGALIAAIARLAGDALAGLARSKPRRPAP